MRIALVHDWLINLGGGERVFLEFSKMFPASPIYTTICNPKLKKHFANRKIITSFLQKIPFAVRFYQLLSPLMPLAAESFDLGNFDVVISSSWSITKGIITKPNTLHINFCHTPTRYVWATGIDERGQKGFLGRLRQFYASWFRLWDLAAASRVDIFLANSKYTAARIKKFYGRNSIVVYPPVNVEFFKFNPKIKREDFYLYVARLIPYKRADLAIEACNKLGRKLKIVSTGPELKNLQKIAGPKIEFLGRIPDEELKKLYQTARALIFPIEEDFGIVPVEAASCGCPTIALDHGGTAETVIDGKTGIHFSKQDVGSVIRAIKNLEAKNFDHKKISRHAQKFSPRNFQKKIKNVIRDNNKLLF